jgi:hypothetical protein
MHLVSVLNPVRCRTHLAPPRQTGRTIHSNLTVFRPPVPIQPDSARPNQESAINRTILFLSKLHQGDIKGAAAATEDPDTQLKM